MAKKKKVKRVMTEEHKLKLRQRARERKYALAAGIKLPTRAEEKAMARMKPEPIQEQTVNNLVVNPTHQVKEDSGRSNNPYFRYEPSPNIKNPAKYFARQK